MTSIPPPPWAAFAVGTPSTKSNWVEPDCVPLQTVSHVTHVKNALSIARAGRLKPDLVYDKSRLNDSRITVNWLSPNDWSMGFRYGNVRFVFDWAQIVAVEKVKFYWVEAIDYQPKACRILVTRNDYDSDNRLVRYDPSLRTGPWWWDRANDTHYWNGKFCLEVMVEEGLGFRRCTRTDFVTHHLHQCCIDPKTCPDLGRSSESAGAEFLAALLAEEIPVARLKLAPLDDQPIATVSSLWSAWNHLWEKLKDAPHEGPLTTNDAAGEALLRAILGAFSRGNDSETRQLAALFASEPDFQTCFDRVFRTAFGKEFPRLDPEDLAF